MLYDWRQVLILNRQLGRIGKKTGGIIPPAFPNF